MIVSLQSSLGIQFRENSLILVYLKKFLREVVLDRYKVVSQPPDSQEDLETFWVQQITRFIKENNIGKDNVWVGIPRNQFLFRFLTLPASAEENLRDVVRYEMDKYVPFPEEDVAFDFVVMEKDAETQTLRLLLLVTKKEVLERYLSVLEKSGIMPLGIETSSTSLLNALLSGKNEKAGVNLTGLIDIGAHDFDVQWVESGRLRYSRSVDFQTNESPDRVEQIKEEIRNSFRAAFSLQSWGSGEGKNNSSVVYLTAEEKDSNVIEGLVKTDEIDIAMFPAEIVSSQLHGPGPIPQNLTGGIGLALKGIKKVPWDINLIPKHLRKKTRKAGLYLSGLLFITVLILSLSWGISAFVKERLVLLNIEQEIAALKNDVFSIQKIQQDARDITREIESLNKARQSEFSKLEIMKELSSLLPSSVWLTSLRCYKNELNLSGFAVSASDLIALLDGSSLFHASEFTAPITRDREEKESFKIKTRIERR